MQNILDTWFDENIRNLNQFGGGMMALDLDEHDNHFSIKADIPGVSPGNIHVNVHDGVLTIDAEIPEETVEREGKRSLIRERRYGRFTRSVRLPQAIDTENVEADYNDGTLVLNLPKSEEARPRSIPVKTGRRS